MAILQNDPTIERIEPNGVTEVKEFVFEDPPKSFFYSEFLKTSSE